MLSFIKPQQVNRPTTRESFQAGIPVSESSELGRILSLPTREPPTAGQVALLAAELERRLSKGPVACQCQSVFKRPCCNRLREVQAWCLAEGSVTKGIVANIGVGHGKSLLDLLMAMVVPVKRCALLLIPSNLKMQLLQVDWHYYGQHWKLPNLVGAKWYTPGRPLLHVMAYSELSGAKSSAALDEISPDVILLDEAHFLKDPTAARTKRFFRYLKAHPDTMLFEWSGTLTSKSGKDWWTGSSFALKEHSPGPRDYHTQQEWAEALDPGKLGHRPLGALEVFGDTREKAWEGYQARVVATPGIITSGDTLSCQASLVISERAVDVPESIRKALVSLDATWDRPDGDPLVDALSVAKCAREIASGFFFRWRFPRGEPVELIRTWLEVRKEWNKSVREKLKRSSAHMDSPLLLAQAAARWHEGYWHCASDGTKKFIHPRTSDGPRTTWDSPVWPEWKKIHKSVLPETEAVWIDDFLARSTAEWLEARGVAWYLNPEFAAKVKKYAPKVRHCGPGKEGDESVLKLTGEERALLSIRAHGTGKNLQMFSRALVTQPPSDGKDWEQLLGRLHRQNQEADEVTFEVFRHVAPFSNAVEKARELSEYIQASWGVSQRLASRATWTF